MKTNFTKYITITLAVLILASCAGQTDNGADTGTKETNNIGHELIERVEDIPAPNATRFTDEIEQYVSVPDTVYKGTGIPISAKFIKELDFVNFGFQFDQITSKHEPNGKEWSDVLSIPDDIGIGEYEIAVTGTPKDGTGALTIYAPIKIVARPKIEVDYDQTLFEAEQTFTVTSETPLDIVRITDQEGARHLLRTKDNITFSTDIILYDASYGILELVAYDRYGLEHKEKLYVLDPDEVRGGSLYGIGYTSWNLEGKDRVFEYGCSIPLIHDEYFESLIDLPNAQIQKIEGRNYGLAISPNNEWLFFANENRIDFASGSYKEGLKFEPDSFYVENEEMIKGINAYTFFLYNRITGERFNLGARYKKYLLLNSSDKNFPGGSSFSMRESGVWYYVLKWTDNNEVYLLEQTKEDGIIKASQSDLYPSMEFESFESPFATAKIVKLSLDDMIIEDTEYEPKRAWVSYADHTTGVIGYTSPEDELLIKNSRSSLPLCEQTPGRTTWLSNLEGTKQYSIADLGIPEYEDKTTRYGFPCSTGYLNNKLYVFIVVEYFPTYEKYSEDEDFELPPYEFADEIYALEFDTGKLIKILDYDEKYYILGSFHTKDVDNKIYLCAIRSIITGELYQNT